MLCKNIRINFVLISIMLVLAACGGGGGGGDNRTPVTATPVQKNVLFVSDPVHQAYAVLPTLAPLAGTSLTSNVLDTSGLPNEPGQAILGMAYDAKRDRLYTANGTQISILEQASTLIGSVKASSAITPKLPGTDGYSWRFAQLSYDKQHDTLYAAYNQNASYNLVIFDNVSTLTGNVSPSKIVKMDSPKDSFFALDLKRSILYFIRAVATDGGGNVLALMDFDKPNATLRSLRLKDGGGLSNDFQYSLQGIAVDAEHDRLYIGRAGAGLLIIDNASASTSTGARWVLDTAPDVKIITPSIVPMTVSGGWGLGLAFDPANDRLYAGFGQNVYIMNQASQVNSGTNVNLVLITTPNTSVNTFTFP